MNIDLPTQYHPQSVEKGIYQKWLDAGAFRATAGTGDEAHYSIVIPPPNVTGALHLGHAINGTIQDILIRHHRMKGDKTLWMPGIDHAGIATQAVVEKTIFEKEKKTRHDLGREELVRRIWAWKEQFGTRILNQLQSIGASCDWERTRFTLDEVCARAVREAFFKMFKDGLIFRGKRLVNWDTHLQTAVADDEIYHETVKGQLTSIRYPVVHEHNGTWEETGEYLVVATTRPETMLGDTAVAVHPEDARYKHLHGKHVILPLVGRRMPVVCDGLLVDPKFGTGVVKVTPAHDPNDHATGQRHKLEMINLLTPDGKVNENGQGAFRGVKYSYVGLRFATAARKKVLEDLEALGLVVDKKVYEHDIGHSDRSKTPIEPYLSDQWFVRMGDVGNSDGATEGQSDKGIELGDGSRASGLAQAAMDAVTSGRVKITPERYAKGYLDWLGQKRDWCISRQLWWGHRIPVWHKRVNFDGTNWIESFFGGGKDEGFAQRIVRVDGGPLNSTALDELRGEHDLYICLSNDESAADIEEAGFIRDPDVLDTWFSSALWPISTMGWPANGTSDKPEDQLLPSFYPTSVLSTAREILTLWVARMVMFGLYCRGDVPFKDVYIHAVIQDGEGRQMKKSLGNGVDPVDIVQSHGADALRFTLASMATETQDIRMPVVKDPKTGINTSPKFDLGRNFANKVWNASRFILSNVSEEALRHEGTEAPGALDAIEDRWILSRLHATIGTVTQGIEQYRFADVAGALRDFFWTDLCDWYLEIAKGRIRAGDAGVQLILARCLRTSLKLLHPVMPFITEALWSKLPGNGGQSGGDPCGKENMLVTAAWPKADPARADQAAESQIAEIQGITSAIREIQNRYPAARGKAVVLQPRDAATQQTIERSRSIIESLAGVTIQENAPGAAKPENAATAVLTDVQVFIGGVIDKAAETAKLAKRRAELAKLVTSNRGKLANESFTAKAPAKIIQGLRDQLARYEEEMTAIDRNLRELG